MVFVHQAPELMLWYWLLVLESHFGLSEKNEHSSSDHVRHLGYVLPNEKGRLGIEFCCPRQYLGVLSEGPGFAAICLVACFPAFKKGRVPMEIFLFCSLV